MGRKAFVQLRELLPRHCQNAELYLSHAPGFRRRVCFRGLAACAPGSIVIAAGRRRDGA